jgi:uncharacterized SAM-binding protein YcdF (DUF218 family)
MKGGARGFALAPFLVLLAAVGLVWWQGARILSLAGTFLDNGEAPQKAEAALVLAGGWQGERVLRAGELKKQGYVAYVLLSGPRSYYEQPECDYAIPFAVKHGYSAEWFQCAPNESKSTEEEARAMVEELKRRGVKKCLVVSVRTHMRRARIMFKGVAPEGLEMHFVAADDREYRLEEWYRTRQGKKAVLLEWLKLATTPLGL